jgi:hypothetical protein
MNSGNARPKQRFVNLSMAHRAAMMHRAMHVIGLAPVLSAPTARDGRVTSDARFPA